MSLFIAYLVGFLTIGLAYGNAMLYCRHREDKSYFEELLWWEQILVLLVYPTRYDSSRWLNRENFFQIYNERDRMKFVLLIAATWPIHLAKSAVAASAALIMGVVFIFIAIIGGKVIDVLVDIILEIQRRIVAQK
jgi:hypothetical protein